MIYTYNPSTGEVETGSELQGYIQIWERLKNENKKQTQEHVVSIH